MHSLLRRLPPVATLGVVAIFAASNLACGARTLVTDGPGEVATSTDAGGAAPSLGTGTPDAAVLADADVGVSDASDAADVSLPASDLGDIFLTSGVFDDADGSVKALVAEARFLPSVAVTGCVISQVAGCTLETCPSATDGSGPFASAGAITVTGGSYSLVLEQMDGGQYGPLLGGDSATAPWVGGEVLTVSATGATVPAFAEDVVAPKQVTVLTPIPPVLSRAAPFAFSWLGASAGLVTVDTSGTVGATDFYLECQFDVATGTGTVPREALSRVPRGNFFLNVSTESVGTVSPGPWLVRTFLQTNASDSAGVQYSGIVSLE